MRSFSLKTMKGFEEKVTGLEQQELQMSFAGP